MFDPSEGPKDKRNETAPVLEQLPSFEEYAARKQGPRPIKQVLAALLKARKDFKPVKKESDNPFFGSKYADLHGYIEATEAALTAQGLVVVQSTEVHEGNRVMLNTRLYHESGEYLDGGLYPLIVTPDKNDQATAQGYGSALTYARRYAYGALLGLAAEDDDANDASGKAQEGKGKKADSATDAALMVAAEQLHKSTGEVVKDILKRVSTFTTDQGKTVPGFTDPSKVVSEKWKKSTLTRLMDELHKAGLKADVGEDGVPF